MKTISQEVAMSRKTQRTKLKITTEQRTLLNRIRNSQKAPFREVQRAKVLLYYADEVPISQIQTLTKVSLLTIYKCIDKISAAGVKVGLKDYYHRPLNKISMIQPNL